MGICIWSRIFDSLAVPGDPASNVRVVDRTGMGRVPEAPWLARLWFGTGCIRVSRRHVSYRGKGECGEIWRALLEAYLKVTKRFVPYVF